LFRLRSAHAAVLLAAFFSAALLTASPALAIVVGDPDSFFAGGGVYPEPEVEGFTFSDGARWSATATDGGGLGQGDPTTIRWGFVTDGTPIARAGNIPAEAAGPSTLITQLDSNFGVVGGGSDLTTRPWFTPFESSFNRIAELSGLSYVYEPNDDGVELRSSFSGVVGVRADVRIGGHSIDGAAGSNILAYNYFPNLGNMVLDTDNTGFYSANSTSFRNIVMHEHGHGLGINHVEPVNGTKLMEPFINSSFEGPQIDDIQALHRGYGDVYEKSNSGAGNEVPANATPLFDVTNTTATIGSDGAELGAAAEVFPGESDFISIDDNSDVDFLSFTITSLSNVELLLTPVGGLYNSRPQDNNDNNNGDDDPPFNFDATAQSDLTLTLFDPTGLISLVTANANGVGGSESISAPLLAPGSYFARVTGQANRTQLYELSVSGTSVPEPLSASLLLLAAAAATSQSRRRR